ncbi:integration host factor subunit alpha [Pajaroellobacter abortibovis]|uniref:Integration host factor subunit alpha n=1 Tax=Pajaroellobacter abortibovis TaxID=1882918 RepID=A0A1L6MWK1_9BACT|nr:integration host factor subunit alpha [Pajaroellobacter abortibovis]APR99815.1 integration host factor subunit alpha [Pajaroellobacter abortibovis]
MTKAAIVHTIHSRLGGLSKQQYSALVDLTFNLIKEMLIQGETVKIRGFGNFIVRHKKRRKGREPQTGNLLWISERWVVLFKPSPLLKSFLNEP